LYVTDFQTDESGAFEVKVFWHALFSLSVLKTRR
jgi:hypothetical protein